MTTPERAIPSIEQDRISSYRIATPCPACGHSGTLFVSPTGHLTCSWLKCPEPSVERWIVQVKEAIGKLAAEFLP